MLPEENMPNHSPDTGKNVEEVAVNLNDVVEVEDAQADGNLAAPLPPAGLYPVKWFDKDEKGLSGQVTKTTPHRSYVGGNIIGKIVASGEGYDDMPVYEYINSLTMRGKPTSDLHHFLNCAGQPAPNRSTVGELLNFALEVLKSNPAIQTYLDWKASYKTDKMKNGFTVYDDLALRMDKFPKEIVDDKWTGKYLPWIEHPVTGEPINAQLYVRGFYTEAEAKKLLAKLK